MKTIPDLFRMRETNDYFLCDGRGFYYFMKLMGVRGVRKTSLPNLVFRLINISGKHNKKIYLLGATGESNIQARKNLIDRYGVKQVSGRDGYYTKDEEPEVVKAINDFAPDILFLGMSSPKKDEFVYRWKNQLHARIIVHCGGMIDVLSGKTKLYPKWVKNLCLAGIYRFIQEPIRLRRDFINGIKSVIIICRILFLYRVMRNNIDFRSLI
jgi:N-acetylglucosaminyldiphosphoundecaprenol N-acetyl-beta-D-mannosaminyltransferase